MMYDAWDGWENEKNARVGTAYMRYRELFERLTG